MRKTLLLHNRHAWRCHRTSAALNAGHGTQLLTIEQLAARLAGGFFKAIDPEAIQVAVGAAVLQPLGELDSIKRLPGFQRAVAATLAKAWSAGLNIVEEFKTAKDNATKARLESLSALERAVLAQLPKNQLRPKELVDLGLQRASLARAIFGRIEIHGSTEVAPVWRPLLSVLAKQTEVAWVAEARLIPDWLTDPDIVVARTPAADPCVSTVSCASPRHEILEAFRWARQHLADGVALHEIAIAAAAPDEWDDHVRSLADAANLPVHFVHGRAALSTSEGQLAAALAEILLRGFSRRRMVRFVALLRSQSTRFQALPNNWWHALPDDAPLLDAARWGRLIESLTAEDFSDAMDHRPVLREIVATLSKGLSAAAEIGEVLLQGKALLVWRKALNEGPPAAIDVTLTGLRMDDGLEPETAIVWAPASALASVPRPFVWLVGLTSRSWPRHASEDPLLPDHVIPTHRLDPLPVHKADRRDFVTIRDMTDRELVCSRARRDSRGKLNGISPLYPREATESYCTQTLEPAHAASPSDRLLARPGEFAGLPLAVSAVQAWNDWLQPAITVHDGLVKADHPVLLRALDRRQSATSLVKLLRDPLGYLWTYGFHWSAPEETDEPLTLDALAFGSLLHEILEQTVTQLESGHPRGFAGASTEEIRIVVETVVQDVDARWSESRPVPPPVVWKRKLEEAAELTLVALSYHDEPFPNERSWAEVPFGGDQKATALTEEALARLPWDPFLPVTIAGTTICIGGSIDRLDIAGDGTRARVTDYKSGNLRSAPPQLKGGAELQRCLYAYAVKALIREHPQVEAQLLYPRRDGRGLQLANPEETLGRLTDYLNAATRSFLEGATLPGPASNKEWYDLAFALPGGAREMYLARKLPLAAESLAALAPLWEEL
jgi:hypothetical protein